MPADHSPAPDPDRPARPAPRQVRPPDAADLDRAWATVRSLLHETAVVPAPTLTPASAANPTSPPSAPAYLKLETLQPTGSFKVRGALAALTALPDGARAVTASAGNHGLGMAYAATATGRHVTVVVSRNASPTKVAKLRAFGIDLVEYGSDYDAAEAKALELAEQAGSVFVSAYNDTMVIAGQASLGRELAGQLAAAGWDDGHDELTVAVPAGGGGLLAGTAVWARRHRQQTGQVVHLVGVEAASSQALSAAVRAGRLVSVEVGDTLADGLAGNLEPGSITPGLLGPETSLTTVSEAEIRAAMAWLFAEHGVVAEGSGAAAVAAVLAGKADVAGRLAVVVTGRNITPGAYLQVMASQAASPR